MTSKRVVFESQSGVFSRNTFVNADFSLTAVENVAVEGRLEKKLVFVLRHGNLPLRYEFAVNDPEQWQSKVVATMKSVSESGPPAPSAPIVKEVIIKEIVKTPCRYCGALVPNTDKYCSGCGAPVK